MKLCVVTNWDLELIEQLGDYPVYEYLGAMAATPVGGGRPAYILPQPDKAKVASFVKAAHDKGIKFNYLLNASCMGNMEYDKTFHGNLLKYLEWLTETGIDSVTVSIPYLLELIKKQFPSLKVKISVIAAVNTVQKAKFYEDMGADTINIDNMCNRHFPFLREVIKAVKCNLSLLVNELCLYQCPYRQYHYNTSAHESHDWQKGKSFYLDYCILNCILRKLTDPSQIIKAPWIRPDDLHVYRALGYNQFKICGRGYSSSWLKRTVAAYSAGFYAGNVMDIFTSVLSFIKDQKPGLSIDNNALDGFLDYFLKHDCRAGCDNCHYCEKLAARAVVYNEQSKEKILKFLNDFKQNMVSSRFFV